MAKHSYAHIASRVLNTPLLLEPGYARVFFNALSSKLGIRNLYDADGKIEELGKLHVKMGIDDSRDSAAAQEYRPYRLVNGVAVLPISGTLVHKHGYLQPYSGMTGYDGIIARLAVALEDRKVNGVLLDFDTPGGEVAGCFDAANRIRSLAAQAGKPCWGLCYDMNASAGMALASAADRRLITQTGIAGSVGVVMAHASWEKYLENEGVDVTLIFSGAHKVDGNPYQALPEDVLDDFQARSDKLRGEFAALVSEMTGMDVQAVLDTEARCYRGQEAIDIGFADQLVNGNEAIEVFADYLSSEGRTTITTGGMSMSKVTENQTQEQAPAANASAGGDQPAATPAPAASADDHRKAERERCGAILRSEEAKGRAGLAEHLAYNTDMTVEKALETLKAAPAESAAGGRSPLDAAMETAANVTVGSAGSSAEVSEVDQVMGDYYKATNKRPAQTA
ncbi:MAG TPA: Clp protease ClpP [Pseudohongiella sp.]|nr:Clp protease ClpP [Pseudohongiella sp.]HBX36227.1 Clp protease ClpP [Pseudohongiella sp.]|tara:strand:- start:17143 stop:18495 length:1353 start_codon:yes stop_codon:yes gene_type:complete